MDVGTPLRDTGSHRTPTQPSDPPTRSVFPLSLKWSRSRSSGVSLTPLLLRG